MLRKKHFRKTRQRTIILEELRKTTSHPTADQVYQKVRKHLPKISLGTVYRNLELLSEEGIIQKLEIAGTQRRYDSEAKNHYHIRCVNCDEVKDIPVTLLTEIEKSLCNLSDYQILGHRLELLGICPRCKKRIESQNK